MNLNRYRYIAAVARLGSISAAARELYVTQPALTKAINKTEEELGVRLFVRDISPVRLTYAGERYLSQVKKILNLQDTAQREMQAIAHSQQGRITLGIPRERGCAWLPHLLPAFWQRRPGVEVRISEGSSQSFEAGLLAGDLDFSICTLPIYSQDLDYEVLCDDPILLIAPQGHPVTQGLDLRENSAVTPAYLDPARLEGQRLLALTNEQGMYRTAMQILERHGVRPHIFMQLQSNETAYRLATAGAGLMFSPILTALRVEPVRRPVFLTADRPLFTRKLIAAYRKGDCLPAHAREFIDLAKEAALAHPGVALPVSLAEINKNIRG